MARPVKARSTRTPSPATAAAMSAAATSSDTSPGSSRATTISGMPAACNAAISARPITVPFLSTSAAWRMEWTATPPSASAIGTAPNFTMPSPALFRGAFSGDWRRRAVISPMIATAISAGDTAPIGEPDRGVDAPEVGVGQALLFQPLEAAGVSLPGAERADIEAVARERVGERRDRRSWDRG